MANTTARPRNDAYTGLLAISFLALVGATALMYMDYDELGKPPEKSVLKIDVPGTLNDFADLIVPEMQRRGLYRLEYEGAIYHLLSRGDRREDIFRDAADRRPDSCFALRNLCFIIARSVVVDYLCKHTFARGISFPLNRPRKERTRFRRRATF